MRIRMFVVAALVTSPMVLSAQIRRRPGVTREPATQPASLPPEMPEVGRSLAYRRSRLSTEAYAAVSTLQLPAAPGLTTSSTNFGAGTHADFRLDEHFALTGDMTLSYAGDPTLVMTAEVGSRFTPRARGARTRPFVDLRAGYVYMYNTLAPDGTPGLGGSGQQYGQYLRYMRGFGGVTGTGFEYSLTNSLAVTTEVLAMRDRLTTYRSTSPTVIPTGSSFWVTSYRLTLGIRYNAARALMLSQNPRQ